jgi:hypothetical protein
MVNFSLREPLVWLHADAAQFLRHQSGDDDPGFEVGAAVSLGGIAAL